MVPPLTARQLQSTGCGAAAENVSCNRSINRDCYVHILHVDNIDEEDIEKGARRNGVELGPGKFLHSCKFRHHSLLFIGASSHCLRSGPKNAAERIKFQLDGAHLLAWLGVFLERSHLLQSWRQRFTVERPFIKMI
jgi:hypothetical protein